MEKGSEKRYDNGEITIVWKPELCIHSTHCWKKETGLPQVFNPRVKPWIRPEGAPTEKLISQISRCPSGALSYVSNLSPPVSAERSSVIVETISNGPLLIKGEINLRHHN